MAIGLAQAQTPIGLFTGHTDVGTVLHPGSVQYDAARHEYTISGSGENVWATSDAFQFVWKKMEGDFTLTADISVLGQGGDPHKKAMLMARQSLDADSAYADVALHGVGLTSLQSRDAKGADTHEIQSNISAPKKLRLQKYGDEFTMWLAGEDGKFQFAGGSMRVPMTGAFYVGLGVCAHDKDAVERAEFGDVALGAGSSVVSTQVYGTLETIDIASTDRRVTYVGSGRIGAPSWTPDGVSMLIGHDLHIESVPVAGGEPRVIDTGSIDSIHFYQGVSPDGTMLAFTSQPTNPRSNLERYIYVVPVGGGAPRRVTAQSPSYFQGWSPDGKTIVFLGWRHDELGIYTIRAAGGAETRLAATRRDGSAAGYSPDGKYIYYNSNRSGSMEIWRMMPDGSQPEQVTRDGAGNCSPHVSPDGRLLAFLTRQEWNLPTFAAVGEMTLRVITLADGQIRVLAKLTGGPGTMLGQSWSPDSRRLAFVSYQFEPPAPGVVK
jgi:Tol biopolymer transport system component